MKSCKIDAVNVNILRALMRDARTSFTAMAKANKTTVSVLRNRYLNLKKAGVITGSMMLVNPRGHGF